VAQGITNLIEILMSEEIEKSKMIDETKEMKIGEKEIIIEIIEINIHHKWINLKERKIILVKQETKIPKGMLNLEKRRNKLYKDQMIKVLETFPKT
jgi:hypothetical protein